MSDILQTDDYHQWIVSIKKRINVSQIKAAIAVNRELLELYWFMGEQIIEKQQSAAWGDGFLERLSMDLLAEFPETKGFSYRNLRSIRQWVSFWLPSILNVQQDAASIGKQVVSNSNEK